MKSLNFTPFPTLTTERLILRKLAASDAPALLAMRSHHEVLRHLIIPKMKSIEEAEQFIQKLVDGTENNEWINWAICRKDDPHLMGTYVFWHISTWNRRAEIGYMLHPDFQRKGYVQESTVEVLHFAFEELGFHSLEARTDPKNDRSIRVLERNGFVREALFKENVFHDGHFLDTAVYSLINPNE